MEDQVGSGRATTAAAGSGREREGSHFSPSEKLLEAAEAAAAAAADRFWRRRRRRRWRCSFWEKSHSTKCLRRVGRGEREKVEHIHPRSSSLSRIRGEVSVSPPHLR